MTVFEKTINELIKKEGWMVARTALCNLITNCKECPLNNVSDCSEDKKEIAEILSAEMED